jgi:hypothetical protein
MTYEEIYMRSKQCLASYKVPYEIPNGLGLIVSSSLHENAEILLVQPPDLAIQFISFETETLGNLRTRGGGRLVYPRGIALRLSE